MGFILAARFLILGSLIALPAHAAPELKKPPYWASISAGKARTRTGPGRNYPAIWLYQRRGLPVRVIETFPAWRKIEDPDGAQGWVMSNLLTDDRTAIVRGGMQALRKQPGLESRVTFQVEEGAVGHISKCTAGWCRFEVDGKGGYIETAHLWGVGRGEVIE
ncbi:SH3 domain-containing protein [Sphingomonas sp. ID0503]|uniref:SH3 domain-containing protein n=1 Tax=Sphingomonas sp. ID0503 TaxID=3399691 RepID=UPI003AFB7347